ncbi:hypothetical protein MACK_000317 [Theileria orientalis]|uniref:Zinc finger ZPR1-type domain-containing protein n=1 Tax=Theileria orientalis TaxID=68886 RepID=A0A976QU95_THEOR|nr:hypothetical protein MACK_000317 [Theileria orientalis]
MDPESENKSMNKSESALDVLELDTDQAEIESACISCGGKGITRMLLTKIPHFNDIVVMSFECKECPYKDNEIQNAASLRDYGVKFQIKVDDSRGLNNQIVISNTSSIKLIDIDFEIPKIDRKGIITTLEGLIVNVINNLDEHIRSVCEELMRNDNLKIELSTGELKSASEYIGQLTQIKDKLLQYSQGQEEFNIEIDDPSGNSYIEENEYIKVVTSKYTRTNQQLKEMGYLYNEQQLDKEESQGEVEVNKRGEWDLNKALEDDDVEKENLCLIVDCPNCGKQGINQICQVVVPGFGNCIIMSFICEFCGSKTNELKPGGGYKDHGKLWKLKVENDKDLNRDVIISETASIRIEQLDFEMTPGTIGSVFTSVEGIIKKIVESLESSYPFLIGDSVSSTNTEIKERIAQLNSLTEGCKFTLVLDDPTDNSFISSVNILSKRAINELRDKNEGEINDISQHMGKEMQVDSNLSYVLYERTHEQNEELGLNDINTEDY